jgi:hypothetical protein
VTTAWQQSIDWLDVHNTTALLVVVVVVNEWPPCWLVDRYIEKTKWG